MNLGFDFAYDSCQKIISQIFQNGAFNPWKIWVKRNMG